MKLHVYLVPLDGTIRQGFTLLPDPNHTCSHDVTLRIPKANLALRGVHHANKCALPVRNLRRALCEQNTLLRPRRVSHTRPLGEPIRSKSLIQPTFCPSRDRQHPPLAFTDRVSLPQPRTRRSRAQHGTNLALAAG